jgi:hypothetical protein
MGQSMPASEEYQSATGCKQLLRPRHAQPGRRFPLNTLPIARHAGLALRGLSGALVGCQKNRLKNIFGGQCKKISVD